MPKSDFEPDQSTFNGQSETDVLLPPSSIEIEINGKKRFSIVLGESKEGIYPVNLQYRDDNNEIIQFHQFEMRHVLKNNVKVDVDGSIINFSFEIYPIDGESQTFSYTFFFSNSSESKFEFGNPLELLIFVSISSITLFQDQVRIKKNQIVMKSILFNHLLLKCVKENLDKEMKSFKKLIGIPEFHQFKEIQQQAIFLSPMN